MSKMKRINELFAEYYAEYYILNNDILLEGRDNNRDSGTL